MHVGSLPDVLAGRNIYEEHAGGMWGILHQEELNLKVMRLFSENALSD